MYTTDDWDRSLSVIPTGTSGIPKSVYYCDQTELFLNGQYRKDFVSKQLVRGSSVYRMTLK
ncbi:MAG: penicillin acylase family protein [Candidatus Marinimicrobia bacterium]|nr:penicillin acylase family protein [Candidatus Neomarinimicrobiota bacterium]